jgi:hypothetical protein
MQSGKISLDSGFHSFELKPVQAIANFVLALIYKGG